MENVNPTREQQQLEKLYQFAKAAENEAFAKIDEWRIKLSERTAIKIEIEKLIK